MQDLVDESEGVALERAVEIDGNDTERILVCDGVHLDGESAVVAVRGEVERDFRVV